MTAILGRYGPFFLTSYFMVLCIGTLVALAVTARHAHRLQLPNWIDGVLLSGIVAVIAGRVGYVVLNQAYFDENPGRAWDIWQGGLTYHTALLAGLLTYFLWLRLTKRPIGAYFDLIAPGLAIMSAAGWAACWFEGCAYGRETIPGLFTADLPDNFGVMAVRYQTQAAGFLLSAVGAGLASWRLSRTELPVARPGRLFWLTLAALAAVHATATNFRGDPAPIWFGIRLDLLLDLLILAASLFAAALSSARPVDSATH